MTETTPGPWRFAIRTSYPNGHVNGIWGANGEEIVVTDSGYYPPTIADAHLIAAAPELLAAAKDVLTWLSPDISVVALKDLRAAIAKAEGK